MRQDSFGHRASVRLSHEMLPLCLQELRKQRAYCEAHAPVWHALGEARVQHRVSFFRKQFCLSRGLVAWKSAGRLGWPASEAQEFLCWSYRYASGFFFF